MNKSIPVHVPVLSKSTQLGTLQSYHSEAAAIPEPPKALLFFLGVMEPNVLDASKSEGVITYNHSQVKMEAYLGCYTPRVDQIASINSHTQKDHAFGPAHTIFREIRGISARPPRKG